MTHDGPHIEVRITDEAILRYFALLLDDAPDEQLREALKGADPDELRSLSKAVTRVLDGPPDEEVAS